MTTPPAPVLQVSDQVLAKIAAHAAVTTPGVARLQPALTRVLGRATAGGIRGRRAASPANGADPAAVIIEHPTGPTVITVQIIATGQPPVLATTTAVAERIRQALQQLAGQPADVRVHVAAFDPQPAAPNQLDVTHITAKGP